MCLKVRFLLKAAARLNEASPQIVCPRRDDTPAIALTEPMMLAVLINVRPFNADKAPEAASMKIESFHAAVSFNWMLARWSVEKKSLPRV